MNAPITFINNTLETFTPTQSGALATIIWECCRAGRKMGVEPVVITRRSPVAAFEWPKTIVIEPPALPKGRLQTLFWRAERRLTGWRHLRHRQYANLVVRDIEKNRLGDGALVLLNEPEMAVVLRKTFPSARIVHWFQNQQNCKPEFRERFAGAADVVLGVSNFTARWIEQYYQLPQATVKTLYNAVDAEHFIPRNESSGGLPVVGFVGRTGIEKAPDLLLESALLLMRKGLKFGLQLVGSNHWDRFELDDYQKRLNQLVMELESGGIEVRRPGHVGRADLPRELQRAHIHVVPARWDEPFGMTTLEGMACGLAVIAARTGGTPEVVGDAGRLFERESVSELAGHLTDLILDPGAVARLGQLARERAFSFSWENVWESLAQHCQTGALCTSAS